MCEPLYVLADCSATWHDSRYFAGYSAFRFSFLAASTVLTVVAAWRVAVVLRAKRALGRKQFDTQNIVLTLCLLSAVVHLLYFMDPMGIEGIWTIEAAQSLLAVSDTAMFGAASLVLR